ncbi:MAG: DUF1194 domain-containing protein [Alphaproteobacteria bacterium]|nr:DUF1194 domain-containing protein [Alphaproteobacteria bacterium]
MSKNISTARIWRHRRRSTISAIALLLLLAMAPAARSHAADLIPVDLELVLAVDISGSIDPEEAQLQRDGYVAALTDPALLKAIQGGFLGRIAVTYVEWAGAEISVTVANWTMIEDERSARNFAAVIARAPVHTALWTSIHNAIEFALPQFENNKFQGTRRVIDISGDGPNNKGGLVTVARDRAIAMGVTINGLPIVNSRPSPFGWPAMKDVDLYYGNCVIGGPGAFYIVANSFADFARAIRKKLILEIAGRTPPPVFRIFKTAAGGKAREIPPCNIGELRFEWFTDEP